MTDTETVPEITEAQQAEIDKIVDITKKGFSLKDRLQKRGLRKATLTLYLDEEKGPELGWVYNLTNGVGQVIGRERHGVLGTLDEAQVALANWDSVGVNEAKTLGKMTAAKIVKHREGLVAEIEKLEGERDVLVAELTKTALTVNLRAVPPVIQKDARRRARTSLGITEKGIPEDRAEELAVSETAHLMSMVIQSIMDNQTGEVNAETSYEDAIDLMGYLPPGQYARLDQKIGELQFMDAISLSIESQEDFS